MENPKRFYRSRYDTVLGGVAGGLAKYFNIDPIIVRILFVALAFAGAGGIIIYIILWIAVPLDPDYTYFKWGQNQSGYSPESTPESKATENSEQNENDREKTNDAFRPPDTYPKTKNDSNFIAAVILIVFGGILLFINLIPHFSIAEFWPVILIAIGVVIMVNALSKPKSYY
ncbi:MAG: PspC domain-containing protein [Candidatus Moranbacteria bacterium]|nr:PspC domain-containing protein [Candidatus Moranbacteria bacterium]